MSNERRRHSEHLWILGLLWASLACVPRVVPVDHLSQQAWIEVQTRHIRLRTTLDEKSAEKMALDLEQYRRAMLLYWSPSLNPDKVLDVVALSQPELRSFYDKDAAGLFIDQGTDRLGVPGALLVLVASHGLLGLDSGADVSVQMHELAHAVVDEVIPQTPRWVSEGLGTYLETARITASGQAEMGRANATRLVQVRRHGRIPLRDLFAWTGDDSHNEAALQSYYASSWAWMHFLVNAEPQRLLSYLNLLARGDDPERAWGEAFRGISLDELDVRLNQHLRGVASYVTLTLPEIPREALNRRLSATEVHYTLGRLSLLKGRTGVSAAREHLTRALQLEPTHLGAKVMLLQSKAFELPPGTPIQFTPEELSSTFCNDVKTEPPLAGEALHRSGSWISKQGSHFLAFQGAPGLFIPDPVVTPVSLRDRHLVLEATALPGLNVVALFRSAGRGACVLNLWSEQGSGSGRVGGVFSEVFADQSRALIVVHLQGGNGPKASDRWLLLGTDGARLWPAHGDSAGLISAQEVTLNKRGEQLEVAVRREGKTTLFQVNAEGRLVPGPPP